jgi:hypothetical protein
MTTPDARPIRIDGTGRVTSVALPSGPELDGELTSSLSTLLCAHFVVLGARVVAMASGHLGIVTVKERAVNGTRFYAGTALRAGADQALGDAALDAFLGPYQGSILAGGAARLVGDRTCRAARVHDDIATRTFGPSEELPPPTVPQDMLEPGARVAVRTPNGDFRGISLGDASVMLGVTPGWDPARRVEDWFDALETALDIALSSVAAHDCISRLDDSGEASKEAERQADAAQGEIGLARGSRRSDSHPLRGEPGGGTNG